MNRFLKLLVLKCCLVVFIAVFSFSISINGVAVCTGDDSHVAVGEGIIVTDNDVRDLEQYMRNTYSFSSSYEQHVKAALRYALFAKEAHVLGLVASEDGISSGKESVEQRVVFAKRYIDHLLSEYPVSDIVVKSYYLSHPKEFQKSVKREQIAPFKTDEDIAREMIIERVREVNRSSVAAKAFEDLKKKYKVRIVRGDV